MASSLSSCSSATDGDDWDHKNIKMLAERACEGGDACTEAGLKCVKDSFYGMGQSTNLSVGSLNALARALDLFDKCM